MSYRLRFDRAFMRRLEALPGDLRSVARRQVRALADQPRPRGSKELDDHPGFFRLWLPRDQRLVYLGPKTPQLYEQLGLGREPDDPS